MTSGDPTKLLLRFLAPLLIGNIFQQLYNFADSVIVGRLLGPDALAAVGAAGSVTFLFFSFCLGVSTGGGIVASQFFGAKNDAAVKSTIFNAAVLMCGMSVLMGTAGFLAARPILSFLRTPDNIIASSTVYLRTSCAGVLAVGIYNYISSMLRALGDSRTPLYFLIGSSILNICLDLFFVGRLGMGVFGAAFATVISQAVSGILCVVYARLRNPYFALKRGDLRLRLPIIGSIMRLGSTLAFQYSTIAISTMALQGVVNTFGSATVAAFTATSRIEQVVQQPFGSLGMSMSTYAGQNYGASRHDRIRLGLRRGMILAGIYSAILIPLMFLFGDNVVGFFTSDPEVIRLAGTGLRITCWFYIFLGTIYVVRGALNGVGDALFPFVNGLVEVAARILIPGPLTRIPAVGRRGIWISAGLVWLVSAAACVMRYAAWRRRNM